MDERLLNKLACPECRAATFDVEDTRLVCMSCNASFPIRRGVPIMHIRGHHEEDLKYAPVVESRWRGLLRSYGLEPLIRSLWHKYLAVDRLLTPRSPSSPFFWMDRVIDLLPEGTKDILDVGGGYRSYGSGVGFR